MSVIIIPRRSLQKPSGRVTPTSEALAMGLKTAVLLGESTPRDVVSGRFLSYVGSGSVVESPMLSGVGARFGQADGGTYLPVPIGGISFSTTVDSQFSAVFVSSHPGSGSSPFIRCSSNANAIGWRNNGAFDMRLGGRDFDAAGSWPANHEQRVAVTWLNGGGTGRLAANGRLLIEQSVGNATLSEGAEFRLHRNGTFAEGANCTTALFALFAADIGRDAAVVVSNNPWQLFRADPVRIYSLPSGALTINSITASNITSSGARITLGLTR